VTGLRPLSRGVSGRITRLRVIGTKETLELSGELAIRRALSTPALWSSLFAVERSLTDSGDGEYLFTIRGAGWGHGVGMCQAGAAMMAQQGKTVDEILKHYYSGIELTRIY